MDRVAQAKRGPADLVTGAQPIDVSRWARSDSATGLRPASPRRANTKDTMARKTQPVSKLV